MKNRPQRLVQTLLASASFCPLLMLAVAGLSSAQNATNARGSQAVDSNTVPTKFIERVEVLNVGASSLYGSDAVAGVVSIVHKRSFEGVAANRQLGQSEAGDDKKKFALTFGNNGRNSLAGQVEHRTQSLVLMAVVFALVL
jgi:iron complex outermembrane receptor protein